MPLTSNQIAEILGGLGQSRAGTALEKRRRAIRVKHNDVVRVVPCVEGMPRIEQPARLINFSPRGVALRLKGAMPAGSHMVLILQSDDDRTIRLLCEIMHCNAAPDGTFSVGAEYVGIAPEDENQPALAATADEARRIAGSILD